MREIKFRAWDSDNRKMLTPDYLVESGLGWVFNNDGFHPMQYTGLKDKNGVEIYEGDILASGRLKQGAVIYGECSGGGPDEGFSTMGFYVNNTGWDIGLLDMENPKVIGNIYENPELLT